MLVSVHIPKTGGGSFRSLLERSFGDRLFPDYADRPFTHDDETRNNAALRARRDVRDMPEKYDCVHGHFLPTKYDIAEQRNSFAAWFRCPYDRVMSRYHFGIAANLEDTKGLSLDEFCRLRKYHNFYDKWLWNFPLERFDFVGITEDYDDCISVFCRQFGLGEVAYRNRHVNPHKVLGESYEFSDDLREFIFENNRRDFEIYEQAVQMSANLKERYLTSLEQRK